MPLFTAAAEMHGGNERKELPGFSGKKNERSDLAAPVHSLSTPAFSLGSCRLAQGLLWGTKFFSGWGLRQFLTVFALDTA